MAGTRQISRPGIPDDAYAAVLKLDHAVVGCADGAHQVLSAVLRFFPAIGRNLRIQVPRKGNPAEVISVLLRRGNIGMMGTVCAHHKALGLFIVLLQPGDSRRDYAPVILQRWGAASAHCLQASSPGEQHAAGCQAPQERILSSIIRRRNVRAIRLEKPCL